MDGSPLLLALLLAAAAALQCIVPAVATAETTPHEARCASPEIAAASIRRATRRLCDSQPIADALASVQLGDDAVASTAADLLSNTLGIRTALDLQLLEVGGPEAEELFDSLKAGGLTVGARAKIRLLLQQRGSGGGDTAEQQPRDRAPHLRDGVMDTGGSLHSEGDAAHGGRALQEDSSDGMSLDTIAIVLSVLVGGAGYVLQVGRPPCCFSACLFSTNIGMATSSGHHCEACGARAAGSGPGESLCRVRGKRFVRDKRPLVLISSIVLGRMRRQREHEQMVAQIKRTDRAQF